MSLKPAWSIQRVSGKPEWDPVLGMPFRANWRILQQNQVQAYRKRCVAVLMGRESSLPLLLAWPKVKIHSSDLAALSYPSACLCDREFKKTVVDLPLGSPEISLSSYAQSSRAAETDSLLFGTFQLHLRHGETSRPCLFFEFCFSFKIWKWIKQEFRGI